MCARLRVLVRARLRGRVTSTVTRVVCGMADSREASRRGGALKARLLRPSAAYGRLLTGVFHGPRTRVTLARAWRARSGAHPCSVGRFCAQFFAARPIRPSALRFSFFNFFYLFYFI